MIQWCFGSSLSLRCRKRTHQQHQRTNLSWCLTLLVLAQFSTTRTADAFDIALLERAASLRRKIPDFPRYEDLHHPSAYWRPDNMGLRGMCNWVIPNRLMVGQYPGQSPEPFAPNAKDIRQHIQSIVQCDAKVNMFCSLQSEIPPQDNSRAWKINNGEVYFRDFYLRQEFPRPFKHYAPIVKLYNPDCRFLHAPIDDCDVPSSEGALTDLLMELLDAMDEDDRVVYVHCWGGRGRAGLVGACILSLIFPEKDPSDILDLIQFGYDTRAGAKNMPEGLQQSPQTERQRHFVRLFVEERQRHHFFFKSAQLQNNHQVHQSKNHVPSNHHSQPNHQQVQSNHHFLSNHQHVQPNQPQDQHLQSLHQLQSNQNQHDQFYHQLQSSQQEVQLEHQQVQSNYQLQLSQQRVQQNQQEVESKELVSNHRDC